MANDSKVSTRKARLVPCPKRAGTGSHLKPHQYPKGVSGNPAGKPKGTKNGLRACLRAELSKQLTPAALKRYADLGIKLTEADVAGAIAERICQAVIQDVDGSLVRTIFEQTEKPLKQTIGLEGGEDGAPVEFILPPMPILKKGKKTC